MNEYSDPVRELFARMQAGELSIDEAVTLQHHLMAEHAKQCHEHILNPTSRKIPRKRGRPARAKTLTKPVTLLTFLPLVKKPKGRPETEWNKPEVLAKEIKYLEGLQASRGLKTFKAAVYTGWMDFFNNHHPEMRERARKREAEAHTKTSYQRYRKVRKQLKYK